MSQTGWWVSRPLGARAGAPSLLAQGLRRSPEGGPRVGWGRGRWALGLLLAALTGLAPLGRAQAGLNIWTSGGPEGGGTINALAIDPTTPGTVYAGGDGASKSATGGSLWIPINTGLGTTPVLNALAIDPHTPATLYAGIPGGGVFKSSNGGANWSPINTGLPDVFVTGLPFVDALAIDPQTPATLYAGTFGGVFKSSNGGATWSPMNAGLTTLIVNALAIDPQTPATLYAGSTFGGGVFKSSNGGASWSPLTTGLTNTTLGALALNPSGTCLHAGTAAGVFDFAAQVDPGGPAPPTLLAALLPASRAVQVGTAATAFATILNAGTVAAVNCGLTPIPPLPAAFLFQTTNPATNALTGTPNTPVDIPPGAAQSFLFAFTPTAPFASTDTQFSFRCTNTAPAPIFSGLTTLLFSASATPVPDIVALGATIGNTGIVILASVGAFAVATVNVGASGLITASADTGAASLPVSLALCQTNPTTGACLAPPTSTVTTQIDANATPTFGVFVTGSGAVPFDPANNRIVVRFKDGGGITRGATSVAVRTQ